MYVRQLKLRDFRSWASVDLELEPGRTVFVAPNGFGKTNLLEALWYSATLGSHRVASDAPLIRAGQERSVISTIVANDGREMAVDLELVAGRANKARLNRNPVRSTREVLGVLRAVLFAPEDLALVRGDPGERRRYLDELATLRRPRLAGVRADYDRVLKQRTALLKSASGFRRSAARSDPGLLDTLEAWDGHLATYGAELIAARLELVAVLAPQLEKAYQLLAPASRRAAVGYRSSVPDTDVALADGESMSVLREAILAALQQKRNAELERGVCLIGPHRDDLELMLGEQPAKGYASHGESWSFALSLRLAAYRLLAEEGGEPVLLLDDVFAELDNARRQALTEVAADAEQVLVTAAVAEDIPVRWDARRLEVGVEDTGQGRVSVLR